jgi:flagellar biosynthesis/type III secretory pathway M-ring protein FliF/YscJ
MQKQLERQSPEDNQKRGSNNYIGISESTGQAIFVLLIIIAVELLFLLLNRQTRKAEQPQKESRSDQAKKGTTDPGEDDWSETSIDRSTKSTKSEPKYRTPASKIEAKLAKKPTPIAFTK